MNNNRESFLARHQHDTSLEDICRAISYGLKNRGDAAVIYPAGRLAELLENLALTNLQPKRIRFVYSYPESEEANLILVESKKNGGVGCATLAPLYIYDAKQGAYSEEVTRMYEP